MQITRRYMIGAGTTAVTAALAQAAFARWEASERYPDPAVRILDPSFARYRQNNAALSKVPGHLKTLSSSSPTNARFAEWS